MGHRVGEGQGRSRGGEEGSLCKVRKYCIRKFLIKTSIKEKWLVYIETNIFTHTFMWRVQGNKEGIYLSAFLLLVFQCLYETQIISELKTQRNNSK